MTLQHCTRTPSRRAFVLTACASALTACGGGYGGGGYGGSSQGMTSRYAATVLISDQPGGARIDAGLVNPWAMAFGGGSTILVTSNGSMRSTLFSVFDPSVPSLTITAENAAAAGVTGAAFNPTNGFSVGTAGTSGVARFIVASEGGTLSGWAPSLGQERAFLAFDGSAAGAVYTGLAMTPRGVDSVLLAADFHNGVVETFGPDFVKQPGATRFVDAALPAGYAPFGIAVQNELVYVAYARPGTSAHAPLAGAGFGLVNAFDLTGRLERRLVPAGEALNAPWSIAVAPAGFGSLSGALLVANAGNGTIAAFDATDGRPLGTLSQADGSALVIDGLHAIAFGTGTLGEPSSALFFTAGPQAGGHGRFGRIDLQ